MEKWKNGRQKEIHVGAAKSKKSILVQNGVGAMKKIKTKSTYIIIEKRMNIEQPVMTPPVDDISRVAGARTIDCCCCTVAAVGCANGSGLFVDMISTSCMVVVVLAWSPLLPPPPMPLTLKIVAGCSGVNVIDCGGDADDCWATVVSIGAATLKMFYPFMQSAEEENPFCGQLLIWAIPEMYLYENTWTPNKIK